MQRTLRYKAGAAINAEWNGLVARNPDHLPLKYRKKALVDKKKGKDSSTVPEKQSLGKSRITRARSSGGT